MNKRSSIKVKFQVYLMAFLLIIITLLGFSAINAIDSFSHKIITRHLANSANSDAAIIAETVKIKHYIIYTCLFFFILISFTLPLLIERLIRPVKEIKRGLEMISRGILSFRIKIASKDEFAFLADKFNEM
ncbi:MAG TPA: HAMP domain-containing protein, partial [Candidatus Kapabacteria bacterium]|nr:HAMP domain-containing protein [Candidatus Kapabacteria bacterium]